MQRIEVSGAVFKEIESKTKKECKNCHWFIEKNICSLIPINTKKASSCKDFEQKPINLILPEDVLKCNKYNRVNGICSNLNGDCPTCANKGLIEIPLNEPIEFVCGECEGYGIKDINHKICYNDNADIFDEEKGCKQCPEYSHCKDMNKESERCPSCSDLGKIEFEKVTKVSPFEIYHKEEYDISIPVGSVLTEAEICKISNSKLKDGKYVLLRVEGKI
jgi:hypothetical protein